MKTLVIAMTGSLLLASSALAQGHRHGPAETAPAQTQTQPAPAAPGPGQHGPQHGQHHGQHHSQHHGQHHGGGHGAHGGGQGGAHGAHAAQPVKGDTGPASQAFRAINDKMHAGMDIAFTGNTDVDFVQGMIPHHEGAVDMAKVVIAFGKDPEIRKLAEEIIRAQETEIAQMKAWLQRNKP